MSQKPENSDQFNQSINPRPANPSESYRDGYVEGQAENRLHQEEYDRAREQQIREENSGTNGVLLGVALTALVALIFGTIFFLTQRNETPTQTEINIPEETESSQEEPPQETETNVIERTVEKTQEVVPVPQESSQPEAAPPPNVEINVPASEPEPAEPEPAEPEPAAEQTPPATNEQQPQEAPAAEPPEPQETPATTNEMNQEPMTETPPDESATPQNPEN